MARIVRKPGDVSYRELRQRIAELEKLRVFVGWLDSAKYDDRTPVAGVAAVHEYGSPTHNIPPRPFLRPTTEEKRNEWRDFIEQASKQILAGNMTADSAMDLLGTKIVGDLKVAIKSVNAPALQPATIDARRRKKANKTRIGNLTKPLVEEAIMINSITHLVGENP